MSGFVTDRPITWVNALLMYAKENKREHRPEQISDDKGNACKEFKLHLKFSETKQVTISVNLITGYISVKGADYQSWINSEFCLVEKYVKTNSVSQNEDGHTLPVDERKEGEPEAELKSKKGKVEHKQPSDIDQLWEENKKLRNAIHTLEEGIKTNTCSCASGVDEQLINRVVSERIEQIEKKFDTKLTTFTNLIEKEFRNEMKEAKKVMNNKVANLNADFAQFKQQCSDEQDGIHSKIKCMEEKIAAPIKPIQMTSTNSTVSADMKESLAATEAKVDEIGRTLDFFKNPPDHPSIQQPDLKMQLKEIQEVKGHLMDHIKNMNTFRAMYANHQNGPHNLQMYSTNNANLIPQFCPIPSIWMDHPNNLASLKLRFLIMFFGRFSRFCHQIWSVTTFYCHFANSTTFRNHFNPLRTIRFLILTIFFMKNFKLQTVIKTVILVLRSQRVIKL